MWLPIPGFRPVDTAHFPSPPEAEQNLAVLQENSWPAQRQDQPVPRAGRPGSTPLGPEQVWDQTSKSAGISVSLQRRCLTGASSGQRQAQCRRRSWLPARSTEAFHQTPRPRVGKRSDETSWVALETGKQSSTNIPNSSVPGRTASSHSGRNEFGCSVTLLVCINRRPHCPTSRHLPLRAKSHSPFYVSLATTKALSFCWSASVRGAALYF